ncbi:CHASE2 domain-containing protein [Magnetofaba australis]|uniref:Putative adenylate cyclase n=1 Tax=Magnetofaba australis IT-1 TaxID=1434232 RepID=A0A1Y2K4U1_9PROT|nr:adenylate/guanylate cyclase domain-containing protein [Magnetofaba australis]OSM02015.1 putative adenylate cyclase [Magnetofaba australis IT-1]
MKLARKCQESRPCSVLIMTAAVWVLAAPLFLFGWSQNLELILYDRLLKLRAAQAGEADDRIVLIGAVEKDINRFNWPLPDGVLAQAIERIEAAEPAVVGIDLYREQPRPPGHEELVAALTKYPNIYGVKRVADAKGQLVGGAPILEKAHRVGFADMTIDDDGVARRGLLFMSDGKTHSAALALKMAMHYLRAHKIRPTKSEQNSHWMKLGETTIAPLQSNDGGYLGMDSRGYQYLVDYQDTPKGFFTLSAVVDGEVPPSLLKDRIVLIGAAADSVKDQFITPFRFDADEPYRYGFMIHAQAINQLLRMAQEGTGIVRPVHQWREWVWIGVWALLGALIGGVKRSVAQVALLGGLAALIPVSVSAVLILPGAGGYWLPSAMATLMFLLAGGGVLGVNSALERQQRAALFSLVNRLVSPQVAEEVWSQRDAILEGGRLQPRKQVATVLFTDLESFTSTSEDMDPSTLMDWLNQYMQAMAQQVLDHGGVVDKYIGDAIMAVFGAPLASETEEAINSDARNAVQCALAMRRVLSEQLQPQWRESGLPPLNMRVGIHTGELVTGSLGHSQRMDYTVIGDTVNVASRLEHLKIDLALDGPERVCRILISEETKRRLAEDVRVQTLDEIPLKGKRHLLTVYRVLEGSER